MATLDLVNDARSPAGHAAFSMRGTDDAWVRIQLQTFTNWVNEQLRAVDMTVNQINEDFKDGIKLCALLEVLQKRRIGRVVKKPINQHQFLDNVSLALKAMEKENIKLVNIGNVDIVNGNLKLTLGMLWHLILHYQIGKSAVPPRKLMIAWLQAVIPECGIHNFNTDWNDGIALHALIDYCKPGTAPNWRQLRRGDGLENCRAAMNLAKQHFDIPLLLSPENLSSADLDEFSGMTYLSYFMKVDSPGYYATLNWVKSQITYPRIDNFQTDWNDGRAITSLVKALGGNIDVIGANGPEGTIQAAMDAAEHQLSVLPVIPASEMASADVDHLGVMAYAAWFQHRAPARPASPPSPPPPAMVPPPPPVVQPPPPPRAEPSTMVALTPHQTDAYPNRMVTFALDILDGDADKEAVKVEVIGPTTKPEVTVNWHGGNGTGQFIPTEPGLYKILVRNEGVMINTAPVDINVRLDASHIQLTKPLQSTMAAHTPMVIGLDAAKVAQGSVRVEARSPSGRITELSVLDNQGVYTANFTPTEVGDWMVSIMYDGQHIQGSPFNVRVYDASQVRVFGLEGGTVGKQFSFSADCSNAGDGELTVDIKQNGIPIKCQVLTESRGLFKINFIPEGPGLYTIRVMFAGMEIAGSPYTLEIVDSSVVSAQGEGLQSVELNRKAQFIVNTHGASGGDIKVNVISPQGSILPASIYNNGDGTYRVEYQPTIAGEHRIEVLYYDKPITGSPFVVSVFDWSRITVENLGTTGLVDKMVEFDIDTSHSGSGNLEIMVNDGTIPCTVQNRGNRKFHAAFMPKANIPHYIQMKFNGRDVPGSPWCVHVKEKTKLQVAGAGLGLVPVGRQASFEARIVGGAQGSIPAQNLSANITGPTRKPVPVQIQNNFNGTFRLDYTPLEVGVYAIEVFYEGIPVEGNPFTSKAYHASAITISDVPSGVMGQPVEFTIDVSHAGEGQLEISVNNGSVPNSVKSLQKGVYLVQFVPREVRSHLIEVKFNGELLPKCPITVPIMDASRVTVQGIKQVAVNKASSFHINTKSAGDADLSVRVTAPSGTESNCNLNKTDTGYDVNYTLTEVGTYKIDISYGGHTIPGSPFQLKTFDPTQVMVTGVSDGVVGKQSSFTVDVNHAGEGSMEISISDNNKVIPNHLKQLSRGKYDVVYTPTEAGQHQANVTFNGTHVNGSPFGFQTVDASKVTATGEGLGLVPCNKPSSFKIHAQGARINDLEVKITNTQNMAVAARVSDSGIPGVFDVEWMPDLPGDYKIEVQYKSMPIKGSPFVAKAWDSSKIGVSDIGLGRIGKPFYFTIDASRSGMGNLEIMVTVAGENVPNFVKTLPNSRFEVSFTPQTADTHTISIKFNGEVVPGSPFTCAIIDGSKAQASGAGLKLLPAHRPAQFNINTFNIGEANLHVAITSPTGAVVPYRLTGNHLASFNVDYTPAEVGRHRVEVKYADVDITGSPFFPEVFNASLVKVQPVPSGVIGQWVYFDVDCSQAGEGTLTVDVHGVTTRPLTEVKPQGNSRFTVGFVPQENSPQTIQITFNQEPVPGSPFTSNTLDTSNVRLLGDLGKAFPVNKPMRYDIETGGPADLPLVVEVTGPSRNMLTSNLTQQSGGMGLCTVDFTPLEVGAHTLAVTYAGQPVAGSPFTCYSYDASRVRVVDITQSAKINDPVSFTIDVSSAGSGDIDVEVALNGQLQQLQRNKLDDYRHMYTFVPTLTGQYSLNVSFNYEKVPDTPMVIPVGDLYGTLSLGADSQKVAPVNQPSWSRLQTQGTAIEMDNVVTKVTAPNGEQVPAKIVQQPDGDYKVEYASKYTGRHTVEILYAGQAIMGSPFYVEIYDPKKIRVEGVTTAGVGEPVSFDIIRNEAGKADLGLTITSPSGRNVPYEIQPNAMGEHVTYVAQEAGPHQIFLTYGGLEVAGSPFTQNIGDVASIDASGDGLLRAEEGKVASFYVTTGGAKGDLFVQVDGPNSIARCKIEPDHNNPHRYIVSYTPVEVGMYTVTVKWNDREIPASPYRVTVVDAAKVGVIGGWGTLVDSNNRMTSSLVVGETKRIDFDVGDAGPGVLTAAVNGPSGSVPVELHQKSNSIITVSFTPVVEGEHQLSLWWSEMSLPRSPLIAMVGGGMRGAVASGSMRSASGVMTSMDQIRVEKVILTGQGLMMAKCKELAEFVIDGTEAGPGTPDVKLTGVKQDIDVQVTPLGANKYRCTYVPNLPGGYLLNIMWSDRQVRGSPFKVTVTDQCDATKVICSGEGLTQGIIGKEIKSKIDTRRAGPGELTAHCMGPTLLAFCELYDHRDGTFTLNVKPQEPGRHILEVKYGGLHVPDSPFELKVLGAPDASKVRVHGPGIEHGILAKYKSLFTVETRGAGAGQLTVRIRGPKAAFRVEMQRQSQKDRTILCRYDPTEVGDYIIYVKWSGEHVPGSPFHVHIFDTNEELENCLMSANPNAVMAGKPYGTMESKSWHAEI